MEYPTNQTNLVLSCWGPYHWFHGARPHRVRSGSLPQGRCYESSILRVAGMLQDSFITATGMAWLPWQLSVCYHGCWFLWLRKRPPTLPSVWLVFCAFVCMLVCVHVRVCVCACVLSNRLGRWPNRWILPHLNNACWLSATTRIHHLQLLTKLAWQHYC